MKTSSHKRNAKHRGVVMIEFSMFFLFLLMPLTLALLQYAIILRTTLAMSHMSREVGRYASVVARDSDADTKITNFITQNATQLGVTVNAANVSISPSLASRQKFSNITVSFSYDMSKRTFLPSSFRGIPIYRTTYTAQATMVIQK